MTIILNEHEWAKNMLTSHLLGKKPTETLSHVARYYIDEHKGSKAITKREFRKKLDAFLVQCDPNISIPKWDDSLTYIINKAFKRDSIHIEHISITKAELDKIGGLKNKQTRRLAFALLCLAKYWDIVNKVTSHWVNTQDSDIMQMANVKRSLREQSGMFHELEKFGYIKFSKKIDNTNVQVCFISDGDVGLQITDFRNLGYQYERYCGESFGVCQNCGLVFKLRKTGSGAYPKYCDECSRLIYLQQSIESVMRNRRKRVKAALA